MIVVGGEALVDLVDDLGSRRAVAGGGPFNTAVALGRLEVPVAFSGVISRDSYGAILAQLLLDAGVDISLVRRSELPTPQAMVHRDADGRNSYAFSLAETAFTDVSPELPPLPDTAWAIHVGTLALAIEPAASAYEALLDREAGRVRIILDPNVRPAIFGDSDLYRHRFERLARIADVVKLSDDDAAWIYPTVPLADVPELILGFGPRLVALTLGASGAVARSRLAAVEVAAMPVTVVDTVGAGDSFGAALVAALVEEHALGAGADCTLEDDVLRRAVTYAVAASAVTCTRTGAVPPSRGEIDEQLRRLAGVSS
ncbi:MAG: carbohydrate kinase family protein [Gaiellaceae bacterium]